MHDLRVRVKIANVDNPDNTSCLVVILGQRVILGVSRRFEPNFVIILDRLCAQPLNLVELSVRRLALDIHVIHVALAAHAPTKSLKLGAVALHDGGDEMLSGVLLHVVPPPFPVDLLTNFHAGREGLGRVEDTSQALSLYIPDGDGLLVSSSEQGQSAVIAWLAAT